MDFKERLYFFGKGSYNGYEHCFFIWVLTTMFPHYGRPFSGVEIALPFELYKSMYIKNMILLFIIIIMQWDKI